MPRLPLVLASLPRVGPTKDLLGFIFASLCVEQATKSP